MITILKDTQLTTALELARLFGVSDRHIRDLANEGHVFKTERGKYLLVASIRGYTKYLEDKNNTPTDLKELKIKEEIERLKKDTELKSLKISEIKNQLHSAE